MVAAVDDCCSAAGIAAPGEPTAAVVVAAAGAVDDAYGDDFGRLVVLWLSVVPSAIEYRQTSFYLHTQMIRRFCCAPTVVVTFFFLLLLILIHSFVSSLPPLQQRNFLHNINPSTD